jgi:hypothetical protein
MSVSAEPRNNLLLAVLPEAEWLRWHPLLEQVEMPLGQVLCEPRATLTHVNFPTSSIVSLLYGMENGDQLRAWPHHGAGSPRAREAHLRRLRGRQKRLRSLAPRACDITRTARRTPLYIEE